MFHCDAPYQLVWPRAKLIVLSLGGGEETSPFPWGQLPTVKKKARFRARKPRCMIDGIQKEQDTGHGSLRLRAWSHSLSAIVVQRARQRHCKMV